MSGVAGATVSQEKELFHLFSDSEEAAFPVSSFEVFNKDTAHEKEADEKVRYSVFEVRSGRVQSTVTAKSLYFSGFRCVLKDTRRLQ